jgi:hypothetical protein
VQITDTWTVTTETGDELARVVGVTMTAARAAAAEHPDVAAHAGTWGIRRLRSDEL